MNAIDEYFKQAELSQAAYANLATGALDDIARAALQNAADMTATQAQRFSQQWTVAATPYNDAVTGVYAVVFQENATGKKTLAIRGTQGATDYLADYFILNGVPPQLNPQYQSLKTKVAAWLGDGTLVPGFTVSGHSLGGYLAAGLVADFSASIDHAYLYNAPGNNSLVTQIMQALGITPTPDAAKITSLRADEGISPIAELGNDFSTPIPIHIENQLDPSLILTAPLAMNHSQQVLTDSLAVYTLIARIDPAISTGAITGILKASSNGAANSLESTLAALGKIFGKTYTSGQTTRDILYDNLQDLQAAASSAGAGALTVTALTSKSASEIAAQARQDTPAGLAWRYALEQLNPFVVTGNASLYSAHNAGGELDLYHPASGTGSLTERYLADRADMLSWKVQYDTTDHAYTPDWNTDSVSGDWDYIDQGTLIDGAPLQLSIDGEGVTLFTDHQIVFGDNGANVLTGSGDSDRLYGGGGDDTLSGESGNDYLEGGTGADTYHINPGDGNDTILDTDGQGSIVYNGVTLTGGTQISTNYWRGANNVTYSLLTTGSSQDLLIDTGAERLTVKDFAPGELGISLPGGSTPPSGQTATGFNIYGDLTPYQMPWDYYLWLAYPT